jgi:hypothetical protein
MIIQPNEKFYFLPANLVGIATVCHVTYIVCASSLGMNSLGARSAEPLGNSYGI